MFPQTHDTEDNLGAQLAISVELVTSLAGQRHFEYEIQQIQARSASECILTEVTLSLALRACMHSKVALSSLLLLYAYTAIQASM